MPIYAVTNLTSGMTTYMDADTPGRVITHVLPTILRIVEASEGDIANARIYGVAVTTLPTPSDNLVVPVAS